MLSVWVNDESPTILVRSDAWKDPAAWGILLADVVRTVALQYSETAGRAVDYVESRIAKTIAVELGDD